MCIDACLDCGQHGHQDCGMTGLGEALGMECRLCGRAECDGHCLCLESDTPPSHDCPRWGVAQAHLIADCGCTHSECPCEELTCPYFGASCNLCPVHEAAPVLLKAARDVIDQWENGDLAGAVRLLGGVIVEIDRLQEQQEHDRQSSPSKGVPHD